MTKDEALRLALEALVMLLDNYVPEATEEDISQVETTITAIKAALEAKDDPVAEVTSETGAEITMSWWHEPALPMGTKLYTTPPQRTWVGLTEEDLKPICNEWRIVYGAWAEDFARAIESKLRSKNDSHR